MDAGELIVVATPIGNLGDLAPRALAVLESADAIYCEDTRRTRALLAAFDRPAGGRLHSLHEHNEASVVAEVLERVGRGERVALVSDAGTPLISDPGERVVAAAAAAGLTVSTVPGPSAVVAALAVSGLPTERFVMEGFLPRKAGERSRRFDEWAREPRTIVFYESPQRVGAALAELAARFGERPVAVVRELTKVHEEVVRGSLAEVAPRFAGEVKGEIVVVLGGAARSAVDEGDLRRALDEARAAGRSTRDAVDDVAARFGVSRREVYALALE